MEVFIVTHGQKARGTDPCMTEDGYTRVEMLRRHLPVQVPEVWIGEAQRHFDVQQALGLNDHPTVRMSAVFGSSGSLDVIDGQRVLVLPDGRQFPFEHVTTGRDMGPSVKAKIPTLADGTVICAGRECIIALGISLELAMSGAVYKVTHDGQQVIEINLIAYEP